MAFVNSFQNFYYNGKCFKYTELLKCTPLPFSGDKIHIKDLKTVNLRNSDFLLSQKINLFTAFKPYFLPKLGWTWQLFGHKDAIVPFLALNIFLQLEVVIHIRLG